MVLAALAITRPRLSRKHLGPVFRSGISARRIVGGVWGQHAFKCTPFLADRTG